MLQLQRQFSVLGKYPFVDRVVHLNYNAPMMSNVNVI